MSAPTEEEIAAAIVADRIDESRPHASHPLALGPRAQATLWIPADVTSDEIDALWGQLDALRVYLQAGADVREGARS